MRIAPLLSLLSIAINISLFSSATPLNPSSSNPSLSLNDVRDSAVCTHSTPLSASGTYTHQCIHAARDFFHVMNARSERHWKRPPVPRGFNYLPFSVAPEGCRVTLDVLDDPNASDFFALESIAKEFRALLEKCIQWREKEAAGYIPVGPRKVMKVTIGPATVDGGGGNGTVGGVGGNGTVDDGGETNFL